MELELMTPFLNGGQINPLSEITVESMADLGYGVDKSAADSYSGVTPVSPMPAIVLDGPLPPGVVDLRGDAFRGPFLRIDEKGRVVGILR